MKAFKCDRCGKLYELTSEQAEKRTRGVNYGIYNSLNNYYLDLCNKCFYELQEWMAVYSDDTSESKEEKRERRVKKHCVYFEGHIDFLTDSEDEEKILDEAYDLMFGNIPDIDVTIANMAIDDDEDEESEGENEV